MKENKWNNMYSQHYGQKRRYWSYVHFYAWLCTLPSWNCRWWCDFWRHICGSSGNYPPEQTLPNTQTQIICSFIILFSHLNQPGPLGAQRFGFKKWAVGIKGYWPPELEITNKCLGKLCNSWHATPKWMHPQRVVVQQKKCVPLVTCWEANQRGLAAHWPDNATYYQWQCSILHDTLCAEITQVNRVAIYFDMSSKAYVIFHGSIFFSAQKLFGGAFKFSLNSCYFAKLYSSYPVWHDRPLGLIWKIWKGTSKHWHRMDPWGSHCLYPYSFVG